MKIIISPAKKMEECQDIFEPGRLPAFIDRTEVLFEALKSMSEAELQAVFKANDQITRQNYERYQEMDVRRALSPALLTYVGIQYQYMAPKLFSYEQWAYVQEHLRILSGFYGILRPDDRVTPYRLEMQAKLPVDGAKDLYGFWGQSLYDALVADDEMPCGGDAAEVNDAEAPFAKGETLYAGDDAEVSGVGASRAGGAAAVHGHVIVNLASKEYSKAIEPYLGEHDRFVTCIFGSKDGAKIKVKATEAKMARGEMVRFMAERRVTDVEAIKAFDRLDYHYSEEDSDDCTFVYLKA